MNIGSEFISTIKILMTDLGQNVTFRRIVRASYDPTTSATEDPASNNDETVRAKFVSYNDKFSDLLDRRIGRTSVVRGNRKAILMAKQTDGSALTKTPSAGDRLIGVGDEVEIIGSQSLIIDGTVAVYVCDVRD